MLLLIYPIQFNQGGFMDNSNQYDINELMKEHGWELWEIQCFEVINQHCNGQGSKIHQFWWDGEDADTQSKLLPHLKKTIESCWNEDNSHEYLFCAIGENHNDAVNMLLRVSDNQFMTVNELIG